MTDKHLLIKPHKIRNRQDCWWYEESQGVCVVIESLSGTKMVLIPWRSLRTALARKDKAEAVGGKDP